MNEAAEGAPPQPRRTPNCALAILDGRMEYARLVELLVRERSPGTAVRAFTEAAEAQRWIAVLDVPVVVLVDAEADRGGAADRAAGWSSAAGPVTVVVMSGPDGVPNCPHAVMQKPAHLDAWRASIDRVLGPRDTWHTAEQWRTPPGLGTHSAPS